MSFPLRHVLIASLLGFFAAVAFSAPAAPSSLVARAGTGLIGLEWDDSEGATAYKVYEASAPNGPFTAIATRDRSRHLIARAPVGAARYYRVTALDAAKEESAPSAIVSATADGQPLDRPSVAGNFRIGSSFVTDSDRLTRFLEARSVKVPTRRFQVIGAPLDYIWNNTLTTNPARLATEIKHLQDGSYDVLAMNAQAPFAQGEMELDGTLLFAEEALAAQPRYRVFIQEYWSDEYGENQWAETLDEVNRARQQRWAWLASVALAYEATQYLGAPVYVAPIGSAVDAAKTAAATGRLEAYKARTAFHNRDKHINNLGKYLQEGVLAAGAYHIDVRGTHDWVESGTRLSPADAAEFQRIIHETVRNTPFSGWHVDAPTTLEAYLEAMREALRVRESFDDFTATGSGTVSNPRNGLTWSFSGVQGYADGYKGNHPEFPVTRLDRKLRLSPGGTLSTTLPRGLSHFSLRLRGVSGGSGTIEVKANGKAVATFTNAASRFNGREVRNLELGGPVTLLLTNTGAGNVELDDLIWDEPPTSSSGISILSDDLRYLPEKQPYSRRLAASGGSGRFRWSVSEGALPKGLSLSPEGLLSGTAPGTGPASFTVRATDITDSSRFAERRYETLVAAPPSISRSPAPLKVALGEPATFRVAATGTDLVYQWYRDGAVLTASNAPVYTIAHASTHNAGNYTVKVSGAGRTVTSEPAALVVDTGPAQALTTAYAGGFFNHAGNTFDLHNKGSAPIVLTGVLQGNFDAVPGLVVTGYWRTGTANGFATSAEGWTQWGRSEPFTGNGFGNATHYTLKAAGRPATVTIPPGGTIGVYLLLTTGKPVMGSTSSATPYTVGNLTLTPQQGLGEGAPFATKTNGPSRLLNGAVIFIDPSARPAGASR